MNISPNNPLKPESQRVWEKITTEHIEAEISRYIGMDNVEELVVVLNLNSQEPPFISASPTVTPTGAPTPTLSQTPSVFDSSKRRLEVATYSSNLETIGRGTRGGFENDKRRTQDANLNIGFSIDIFIRSSIEEHVINHYIGGAFDAAEDRQTYLMELVLADPAFESAQRLNVFLPDPPPQPAPAPASNKNGTTAGIILGVLGFGVGGGLLGFFFVYKKRAHAGAFIKDDSPLEIGGMEVGVDLSQIDLDEKGDVSTLGDPIPGTLRETEQPSAADSFSLDYDFQKAYQVGWGTSVAEISHGDLNNANLLVDNDDDTLEEQYFASDRFVVDAPPGMLGLVLETSPEGMPTVHAIREDSALANEVHLGDRLMSVDGLEVTGMLASDVSRLIATKRDNDVRKLSFTRPDPKPEPTPVCDYSETASSTD
jgi:hypothetical protein